LLAVLLLIAGTRAVAPADLAAAIRTNCATPSVSPRAVGSTPAVSSAATDAEPEPAQPARAERSILRRCANAASITANTSSRAAPVGTGTAHHPHQAGIDIGDRPEHRARNGARSPRRRVPGDLDAGNAVRLRAGRCREPFGDLGLHHHQHRPQARQRARATGARSGQPCCKAGWPPARSALRRPTSARGASSARTRKPLGGVGCALGDGRGQRRGENRIDLDRGHLGPGLQQPQRQRTQPGPTSSTCSPSDSSAARTIRRTVFASWTKFWPSVLVGWTSSSAAKRPYVGRAEQRGDQYQPCACQLLHAPHGVL